MTPRTEPAPRAYDAIVIGAGPAGSTAAIKLARAGWGVLLVDKAPLGKDPVCGGFLGPETQDIFDELEIPNIMADIEAEPVREMIFSGSGTKLLRTPTRSKRFLRGGWGVNRARFDRYLIEEAARQGAVVKMKTRMTDCRKEAGTHILTLSGENGTEIVSGAKLVYAWGRRTPADYTEQSYYGIRTTYRNLSEMDGRVALHFISGGHVGFNQLNGQEYGMCLYTRKNRISEAGGDLDRMMANMAKENVHIRQHLEGARRVSPWQGCLAEPDRTYRFFDGDAYYVGDAVIMPNPIIGAGVTVAMGSASILAKHLLRGERASESAAYVARRYRSEWIRHYRMRVRFGEVLGRCESSTHITKWLIRALRQFPRILRNTVQMSRPRLVRA